MITLTNDQNEKIDLLDRLFGALDAKQLKEFTESEQIVAILKGTDNNQGLLKSIIREHGGMSMEISSLRVDMSALKYDIVSLIKAVSVLTSNPVPYSQDLQTLKTKHHIY